MDTETDNLRDEFLNKKLSSASLQTANIRQIFQSIQREGLDVPEHLLKYLFDIQTWCIQQRNK